MWHEPRKTTRLRHYDYTNENYYFITICTHHRKCLFGIGEQKTTLGKIAQEHIKNIASHYESVIVDKAVVMPNHIHMILVLQRNGVIGAEQIIAQYKAGVSREARKIIPDIQIWQRSFHDHIIRDEQGYQKIWQYIENNPQKWEEDCFYRAQ